MQIWCDLVHHPPAPYSMEGRQESQQTRSNTMQCSHFAMQTRNNEGSDLLFLYVLMDAAQRVVTAQHV